MHRGNNKNLYIQGKQWYYRLVVAKSGEYNKGRALMNDHSLNEIATRLVIAYTPATLGRKNNGTPYLVFALFDSYIEFFKYLKNFAPENKNFFEVIFGELPQKPHFDIDIKVSEIPVGTDINTFSEFIKDAVIYGCLEVLRENQVTLDLKDILIYSSHGETKKSFHIVINNKCHDGNEEAKAFYKLVIAKVEPLIGAKYLLFIDSAVYSSRQQFRIIGSQKLESNRPKIFHEQFRYNNDDYTHAYTEDVSDPEMKELTNLSESLVGFKSGCIMLPSLLPPKEIRSYDTNLADLDDVSVDQCMKMLQSSMKHCPFTVKEVRGHFISLLREAPSHCPLCDRIHDNEHPYIVINSGKVYWNCRRNNGEKNLQLGFIDMVVDDKLDDDAEDGVFMFGDYKLSDSIITPKAPVLLGGSLNYKVPNEKKSGRVNTKPKSSLETPVKNTIIEQKIKVNDELPSYNAKETYYWYNYDKEFHDKEYIVQVTSANKITKNIPIHILNEMSKSIAKCAGVIRSGNDEEKIKFIIKQNEDEVFVGGVLKHIAPKEPRGPKIKYIWKDSKGNQEKIVNISLHDPLRKNNALWYDKVSFIPFHEDLRINVPKNIFNTFPGFNAKLVEWDTTKKELIQPLLDLIKELSNNVEKDYRWQLQFYRHPIATLTKCPKMPYFFGPQGIGKTFICVFEQKYVYGVESYLIVTTPEELTCQFNSILMGKLKAVCDEAQDVTERRSTLNASHNAKLKGLITGTTLKIEIKGKEQFIIPNHLTFSCNTNHKFPVDLTQDSRREVPFKCGTLYLNNTAHFKNLDKLCYNQDAGDAFYTYLRMINEIEGPDYLPDIMNVPQTAYRQEIIDLGKSQGDIFCYKLFTGDIEIPIQLIYKSKTMQYAPPEFQHTDGLYYFFKNDELFTEIYIPHTKKMGKDGWSQQSMITNMNHYDNNHATSAGRKQGKICNAYTSVIHPSLFDQIVVIPFLTLSELELDVNDERILLSTKLLQVKSVDLPLKRVKNGITFANTSF